MAGHMVEIAPKRQCCKCGSVHLTLSYNEDDDVLDCKCEECGFRWQADTYEKGVKQLAHQIAEQRLAKGDQLGQPLVPDVD